MPPYRVFIAAEVIAFLQNCPRPERLLIARLFDDLAIDAFRTGDFVEHDMIGRPINVVVVGRYAAYYWVDHPVKEIKIVDLKSAGH